jgi:peptidoglycan DL-endopeptidase RipA
VLVVMRPQTTKDLVRWKAVAPLLVAVALADAGMGHAVPPPPSNPGDGAVATGQEDSRAMAGRVGELTNRLAEAESRLRELTAQVELKMEDANKARVDLWRAEQTATQAQRSAEGTAAEAAAAATQIERQRKRLDEFVAGSYRQGSKVGSLTAFAGSLGPRDVLDRAEMLNTISKTQRTALDRLERARTEKANKDSLARKAFHDAERKRSAAIEARGAAKAAEDAAIAARAGQAGQARQLEADKASAEARLAQAQANVSGLEAQRVAYRNWWEAKQREEQAAAVAVAQARPGPEVADPVEVVIRRALSQVGVHYAWGGGDESGPTRGIRDGGVADAFGDYQKVGFDCSGLMIYAFAGAGVDLPHYTGYQYQSGKQVPLSQMRRGDLIFWQEAGNTHHVALYLGNGQMVEAPYSGAQVQVTSVRYGGIAPYAVRLL